MAEPVLLISSDPFLGASLEALAAGRIRVARLDPVRRPAAWPGEPAATVVLDVAARQRNALHAWIRHHQGPLVVLLKPGDRRRRRRARRGRRLAAQVLVGLLVVLLVLAGVWLALGLVDAGRDLPLGPVAVAWPAAALDLRG